MSGYKNYKRKLRWKSTMRKTSEWHQCPDCGMPVEQWQMQCPSCGSQNAFGGQWPMVEHPHEAPMESLQVPDTIPQDLERSSPYGPMPSLPSHPDDSSSGLTVPEHFEQGQMTSPQDFAAFMQGYLESALWTSEIGEEYADAQTAEFGHDESFQALHGDGLDSSQSMTDAGLTEENIDPTSKFAQHEECRNFVNDNAADLQAYLDQLGFNTQSGWSQAGHDFWLTRNGHGTGFWDRDPGEVGQRLTAAAKVYGEAYVYMGDDGQVHFQ